MSEDLHNLYQDIILDHNKRPRHYGVLTDYTHTAEGYNPLCGDKITMHIKVMGGVIRDISFEGDGCAISQASASLLTEDVKGKKVEDVKKMINCDVHALLKIPISHSRRKCAFLSLKTIQEALK